MEKLGPGHNGLSAMKNANTNQWNDKEMKSLSQQN